MSLVKLDRVACSPGGRPCLHDLSLEIRADDRLGLVGGNGSGKSTLLRVLAGRQEPDAGRVHRRRELAVGYLPQEVRFDASRSVGEIARALPPPLQALETALARVEARLAEPAVQDDPLRMARVLAEQERLVARHDALGGRSHETRVRALLDRFRFGAAECAAPADRLSGGRKKLLALLRLLLLPHHLLLLDEPDNHLDWRAREELATCLRSREGAFVIVSHDRALLDDVAAGILSLDAGRIERWKGGYSAFAMARERRRLARERAFATQQREIARIEAQIRRFEHWASLVPDERHIRQARSRRRRLERMAAQGGIVERPREAPPMALALDATRGSRRALVVESLAMGFGDELLFVGVDLLVRDGERVGLVGPNGCGKSVLLRIVRGELAPLEGRVVLGPSTRLGWYGQEHERLRGSLDRCALDLVRELSPRDEGSAVAFLRRLGLALESLRHPIRTLSGGERSRLQLACLMLERPNLLLLDEPTNHLDIETAEVLEAALDDYPGALLVVSHDRFFLDRTTDRLVALEDGVAVEVEGGIGALGGRRRGKAK